MIRRELSSVFNGDNGGHGKLLSLLYYCTVLNSELIKYHREYQQVSHPLLSSNVKRTSLYKGPASFTFPTFHAQQDKDDQLLFVGKFLE